MHKIIRRCIGCVLLISVLVLLWILWRKQRIRDGKFLTMEKALDLVQHTGAALTENNTVGILRSMTPWAQSVDEKHSFVLGPDLRDYISRISLYLSTMSSVDLNHTYIHDRQHITPQVPRVDHRLRRVDSDTFHCISQLTWSNKMTAAFHLVVKHNGISSLVRL